VCLNCMQVQEKVGQVFGERSLKTNFMKVFGCVLHSVLYRFFYNNRLLLTIIRFYVFPLYHFAWMKVLYLGFEVPVILPMK